MEPILQSILDSAADGIIVIDARGLIKAFNPAAERLFGYTAAEVLGQNVKLLMPSPDREQHDQYLANYLETKIPKIIGTGREVRGRRKDGSTFPLHLSVGEMELDGKPAFTGILHDLSRRVAIDDALRRAKNACGRSSNPPSTRSSSSTIVGRFRLSIRRPNGCSATPSARLSAITSIC